MGNGTDEDRNAICRRVRDDLVHFGQQIEAESARILRLEPEIRRLQAELRDRESDQRALTHVPSRTQERSPHPLRDAVSEIADDAVTAVQRARLNAEIASVSGQLSQRLSELAEARRLFEEGRLNLDQTARNYQRHRCAELGF